jgi:hypothetical protein
MASKSNKAAGNVNHTLVMVLIGCARFTKKNFSLISEIK